MKRLLYCLRSLQFIGISGLALALCPSLVNAAACQTGSLQSYIDAGATSCTVGDIALSGFSDFSATTLGGATAATASQITVTPVVNPDGTAGFALTAMQGDTNYFSISNPTSAESVTYSLNYYLDPFLGDLGLDPPTGDVTATQNYCVGDVFNDGCTHGTPLTQTVTTASPNSTIVLAVAPEFVDVNTIITLSATPGNPASFDALNIVYGMGADTAVPEPGSLFFMGLAAVLLMAFPALRRHRVR